MDIDTDLLASIASGGLGHWVTQENGHQVYKKDEDCIGSFRSRPFSHAFQLALLVMRWLPG